MMGLSWHPKGDAHDVKALVMAGGEGTRLRPMTANQPKPLLPVVNKPIMEHVLGLLKRHGFTETVVTLQFFAPLVRNYFGDGEDVGMSLQYATEETPLGTAGSVKNAEDALRSGPFLVISGDALTDIDLSAMVAYHKKQGALVTVGLTRVPNPLEFGIIIVDDDGRIQRFLEKPTWGQVFSDTVNTGIYVMEPEVLAEVPAGEPVDWSADVFPRLVKAGAPLYGWVAEGYWQDVGTHESYLKAQADVLSGQVEADIDGFEISPGIWVAEGAEVDPEAVLTGPLCIGEYAKIEAGAELREFTVVGSNVVVKEGAFLHRAVVHNNVFIGPGVTLRGCVICKKTDVMASARIEEGAIVGDECLIEPEAYLSAGVKVYPFKTIEAGAVVNTSVIWESSAQRTLFGPRGVSGLVNVEITAELCVRLAGAYASTLRKGVTVTTSRDVSRAARALKRAIHGALNASAINVVDLEAQPLPVARFHTARSDASGGIALRTTPGDPQSIDIIFLDERGADLSPAACRKLERVFSRQEYRRAFPGEIAELIYPPRVVESYAAELLRCVDMSGVQDAGLKVVLDCAGGTAALVLPSLLGRIGVDVHTLNNRLDEELPTQTLAQLRADMQRLAEVVASSRAAFGVRFDQVGERIHARGRPGGDDQRRPGAAGAARPDRRRAAQRPGRAARHHHPGGRAGVQVPRRPGELDTDLAARAHRGRRRRRRDLRRRWARRVRGAGVQPEPRRHRGVRLAARPGRPHPADAQPDRRPHPLGAPAQALHAHPLGGEGQCHAHGDGGRRRPRGGHHRRGQDRRARRRLGPGAARPRGGDHPPVGRGRRRRRRAGSARPAGPAWWNKRAPSGGNTAVPLRSLSDQDGSVLA